MASEKTNPRMERIRKAIMRELADLIANDLKDPRLDHQVISITDVEVTNDLSHAKVFISILGEEEERNQLMTLLMEYKGKLRKGLSQSLQLRHTPELHLHLDDSLERGLRMSQLLDKIAKGEI
jgi:ribosome-binding factor A